MSSDLTPERAQQILGAGAAASSDERHRIFAEKRALFEKKLGQAPTPGLQAKYRDALDELTRAFELLETAQIDQDLGSVRPDLKSIAPPRPGSEVARGVPAPPPNSEVRSGVPALPKRGAKSQREFRLALAGVAVVVVLLGGWWWKQSADAATEHARQEELAKQEAIVRSARDEAERAAAEAKAAALRNEDDRRKETERRTRVMLAELENNFETLDQKLKDVDRSIADARSAERDLAKAGGWQLEWVQRRRALLEGYRTWLADFATRHPARVRLKSATQLLQGRDVEGAAAEAQAGADAWARQITEPDNHRYTDVGRPLIDWLIGPKEWPDEAFERVRLDEPSSMARAVSELKKELAYVDDRSKKASTSDWRGRMLPLARLAGENDLDFLRWRPRFVGTIKITSSPSGAEAVGENGSVVGMTPCDLTLLGGGTARVTVQLKGYKSVVLRGTAAVEEEKSLLADLEKIRGPEFGAPWTVPDVELVMQWIAPGTFTMGSPASEDGHVSYEEPQLRVTLGAGYWLGKYEVTQGQWQTVMGNNPSFFVGTNNPVENVSWVEAMEFCRKLTEREKAGGRLPDGYEYTLPSEAQWENACRAGTTGAYAGDLSAMAWYHDNSGPAIHAVGQKRANAWGLHDMHGNVSEWCRDWFADSYAGYSSGTSVTNPIGPNSGTHRVGRGGGWSFSARLCRSASRSRDSPADGFVWLGFRLALSSIR